MSIAARWVRDRPQETVLETGRAALPDDKILTNFLRTPVAQLLAGM